MPLLSWKFLLVLHLHALKNRYDIRGQVSKYLTPPSARCRGLACAWIATEKRIVSKWSCHLPNSLPHEAIVIHHARSEFLFLYACCVEPECTIFHALSGCLFKRLSMYTRFLHLICICLIHKAVCSAMIVYDIIICI